MCVCVRVRVRACVLVCVSVCGPELASMLLLLLLLLLMVVMMMTRLCYCSVWFFLGGVVLTESVNSPARLSCPPPLPSVPFGFLWSFRNPQKAAENSYM